jgi:hypothetical protein
MQATQKKKTPRILYACTVLTPILEVHPEKCGFSAYSESCGDTKNALMAVPLLFAQIYSPMSRNTLFKNYCCWVYAAAALC